MKRIVLSMLAVLGISALAFGEDFYQWRGPQRNGLTSGGPALDIQWGAAGPARLWESEDIPGTLESGSGCVSIAGGKAYVYVQWKYKVDITTRTLTESELRQLGWSDHKPSEDILTAMEEARNGAELDALAGNPRMEWCKKWAAEHITAATDKQAISNYVMARLNQGRKALPLDLLTRLETIKNKEFSDQAALDAWFTANFVVDDYKTMVLKQIPTGANKSWDTLICLNAADGKTLWKKQYDGAAPNGNYPYGASSTPTIVDGRCYFCGSKNDIYCLDAATGGEVWKIGMAGKYPVINHSSPLVTNGMVIVAASPLVALDQAKGTILWKQPKVDGHENAPVLWHNGDRTLLLCNTPYTAGTVYCLDLQNGNILWSVPGGGRNTPAIVGDLMVTSLTDGHFMGDATKFALVAYKLSADKAEQLWSKPGYSRGDGSPLIYDGHVYTFASTLCACLELATGSVAWEQKATHTDVHSPVLADGKIITSDGISIRVIRATPEKYDLLGKVKLPVSEYASPAVADGCLYMRMLKNVACYDLTHPTATTSPSK